VRWVRVVGKEREDRRRFEILIFENFNVFLSDF
jgi:hypothetical protein